ncbi:MAG: GGDEF domain-containing protein, partial [Anaeromyxobacteraceae bacterium]
LDLDGFKAVNDAHGHAAGDEVLREVARRLRGTMRGGDTAARIGGDEFVLLLSGARNHGEVERALERLAAVVAQPYRVGDRDTVQISASVGVAAFPEHAADPQALLRKADEAMYAAKARSKGAFAWYPGS